MAVSVALFVRRQGRISDLLINLAPLTYSFVVEEGNRDFGEVADRVLALSVGEVCTNRVISVNIDDDLGEVCRLLADRHLKKAPVLEGTKMVGVINRSNITGYAVRRYLSERA